MYSLEVRDMQPSDRYFVGTCSHRNESDEIDAICKRRLVWLESKYDEGLRVKVALLDEEHAGFLYMMPIEICPWGPLGRELMSIPCLFVLVDKQRRGVGRSLVNAAEEEARSQSAKGLVTSAYFHDFWFMPATFFENLGYKVANRRGPDALLWKVFSDSAELPRFLERNYRFQPVYDKVVVDLFWNSFCATSAMEAQRVREVAGEFGERVILNEYPADDMDLLSRYQNPRGIFINGEEIYWGYEAPKEGVRKAIARALDVD